MNCAGQFHWCLVLDFFHYFWALSKKKKKKKGSSSKYPNNTNTFFPQGHTWLIFKLTLKLQVHYPEHFSAFKWQIRINAEQIYRLILHMCKINQDKAQMLIDMAES